METFLTIELEYFGTIILSEARWLTEEEKQHKNPEYSEILMVRVGNPIRFDRLYVFDLPKRNSDGCFMGPANSVWIISRDEWNAYLSLEDSREKAEEGRNQEESFAWLIADLEYMAMQPKMYTEEESARLRRKWNDTYNDGNINVCVPRFYTKEEYDKAIEKLKRLRATR